MSYNIVVECVCCHELESVSSSVPKNEFLQGYVDRESHYLCIPCWSEFYDKRVKFTLKDAFEPISSRFEILDI